MKGSDMLVRVSRPLALALAAALTIAAAACGSATSPSATTTDSLGGVLQTGGINIHTFEASKAGDISITLTSLDTLPAAVVGMALGTANAGSCAVQYRYEGFKVGTVWTTSIITRGSYCIVIYDTGAITQNVNYGFKVTHP